MFAWILKLSRNKYIKQALKDQKRANYPGCKLGKMKCYEFCDCKMAQSPGIRWALIRAATLRLRENCQHLRTVPKYDKHFESLGRRGTLCLDCKQVKLSGSESWEEAND